jgi:hypothetical protein
MNYLKWSLILILSMYSCMQDKITDKAKSIVILDVYLIDKITKEKVGELVWEDEWELNKKYMLFQPVDSISNVKVKNLSQRCHINQKSRGISYSSEMLGYYNFPDFLVNDKDGYARVEYQGDRTRSYLKGISSIRPLFFSYITKNENSRKPTLFVECPEDYTETLDSTFIIECKFNCKIEYE